ncbi:MAG: Ig-like domain-containing protein, partial [Eubacteriales bacterium]|nr:Ig-like domain-containing protein [Eubacteriales bacterium]
MKKYRREGKKIMCWMLVALLLCTSIPVSTNAAAKVKLNKTSVKLKVGKKIKLKLKNNKKKVKWSSANKKIATVSKAGLVKAKKKGKTKIIAKVKKKKYVCKVTVEAKKSTSKKVSPTKPPYGKEDAQQTTVPDNVAPSPVAKPTPVVTEEGPDPQPTATAPVEDTGFATPTVAPPIVPTEIPSVTPTATTEATPTVPTEV